MITGLQPYMKLFYGMHGVVPIPIGTCNTYVKIAQVKEIGEIDDKTIKILNYSFLVSFAIGIAGMLMLLSYGTYSSNYDIYEGGMLLIKDASMFAAQCFACGFIFDKIKKAQNK